MTCFDILPIKQDGFKKVMLIWSGTRALETKKTLGNDKLKMSKYKSKKNYFIKEIQLLNEFEDSLFG